jgi:hypothetical protein
MASKQRKFEASIELHRVLGHKQTVALHDKKQREKKVRQGMTSNALGCLSV